MMNEQEIKTVVNGLKEAVDKLNDVKNLLDGLGYYITDEQPTETGDSINRQAAIDELLAMLNSDYLDGYKYLEKLKQLPSAQPEYKELTPEEAASEIASGSTMSAWYWLDDMIRIKQMGYVICRKR